MATEATENSQSVEEPQAAQTSGETEAQASGRSETGKSLHAARMNGVLRKKGSMTPKHEQVMKEITPDDLNPQGASTSLDRLERRILVLEKALADIVERHEQALQDRVATAVDGSIGGLRRRLEATEQRHAQTMGDLKKVLTEMHVRLNGMETAAPVAAAPQPPMPAESMPAELVQAEENAESAPQAEASPELQTELTLETPTESHAETMASEAVTDESESAELPLLQMEEAEIQEGGEVVETVAEDAGAPPENVSYLAAARQAAMAAHSSGGEAKPAMAVASPVERPRNRTKLVALACLAPMAIVAAAVFVLNRHSVNAEPAQVVEVKVVPVTPPPQVQSQQPIDPTPAQTAASGPFEKVLEAAEAGDVNAQRDAGLKYLAGDGVLIDQAAAANWLMRAAYQGEPTAEYWLGTLYARGHGVPADAFQANHWYEAAAKQGNPRAMHSLGVAHFEGWGVEKNVDEAARWFKSAADLGLVDAQFNLAVMYERGTGVPRNLSDAYAWYAIAATQGDREAQVRVAALAKMLMPDDLAQAQRTAANFKPQAPANQAANPAPAPAQPSGG